MKYYWISFEEISWKMIGIFSYSNVLPFVGRLLTPKDIDYNIVLLRKEYAWHIGGALSQHELEDWMLLYHSSVNGLSFSTFLGNIS
jgi:hypothetical protein